MALIAVAPMAAAMLICIHAVSASVMSDNRLPFGYSDEDKVVSHYEEQFASLEFPQLSSHLYRRRSRPFTINVEGIVGTGKSTFLTFFQRLPNIDVIPEPVDKWTNLNGTDLLDLLFKDPKRWALAQESYVQLTMLQEHLRRVGIAKVMERSLHSGRFVFVENLARSGQMKKVEYDILDRWYDFLTEQVPGFDLRTDLTVYLKSEPSVVIDRIRKRGRPEEANMSMEFLESLNRLHEDWLVHRNTSFPLPSERIMVIDTSHPLETMKRVYRALAKKIWSMIPKEAKGGNIMCYY